MASQSLKGRTALISGAAKRLGRAIAKDLAGQGVNIVIHYNRSESEARELCEDVTRLGVRAWTVAGDLQGDAAVLFDQALSRAGHIDILVNSASIFTPSTLADLTYEDAVANFRINAWAPYLLSRCFAQHARSGAIVNILDSRVAGYDWNHVGYIFSKHVLAEMTRMMALDYAPGISVNAVAPGLVLPPPGQTQEYLDRLKGSVPLKRHGDGQDVAQAVTYLVSSTFITGQVIYIDGGRHLKEYHL